MRVQAETYGKRRGFGDNSAVYVERYFSPWGRAGTVAQDSLAAGMRRLGRDGEGFPLQEIEPRGGVSAGWGWRSRCQMFASLVRSVKPPNATPYHRAKWQRWYLIDPIGKNEVIAEGAIGIESDWLPINGDFMGSVPP